VTAGHRLHWLYLLTFVALALYAYRRDRVGGGFLRWLFPRSIYTHRSTITDVQVFLANSIVSPATTLLVWFGSAWIAVRLATSFDGWFGRPEDPLAWGAWTTVACTISLVVVRDFSHFFNHWLHHQVPILWPLHAVHHSAEVMTPLTLFRKHPLYDVVKKGVEAPTVGLFQAVVLFAFGGAFDVWTVAGINAVQGVFLIVGSNVRHSHVWIDWWRPLDHILISPAMHQVHHSVDMKHRDRNFGSILSVWDWAFGTLYVPDGAEELVYGLGDDLGQPHDGLWNAWWGPVKDVVAITRGRPSTVGTPGD
jgi:sterol desaturase/sphingolipid hydroxylase (fatty acid hydroxylase superfamily)